MEESRLSPEDKEKLDTYLEVLTQLRKLRKELSDLYIDQKNKFNETHKGLLYDLDKAQDSVKETEDKLRNYALTLYNINPEQGKEIYRNIKERDIRVVEYEDVEALAWCIEHQMFLSYDKGALDTYIRNIKEEYRPSFATVCIKSTITLPMNVEDTESKE